MIGEDCSNKEPQKYIVTNSESNRKETLWVRINTETLLQVVDI